MRRQRRAHNDVLCDRNVPTYTLRAVIAKPPMEDATMTWATPTLEEICIGLEINGYLPAEL